MRKNELKLCTLIIAISVFVIADFIAFSEYENLKNKREQMQTNETRMRNLISDFCKKDVLYFKSKNKIFGKDDVKQQIETVAKRTQIENLQFKKDEDKSVEIKFQANDEASVYGFLEKLYFGTSGVVCFLILKIGRFADNKIHVLCKIKSEIPQINKESISIIPQKYTRPFVNLFDNSKKHQLNCIIYDKKIFIDNDWYEIGDKIDEYQITKIRESSVELKNAEKQIKVQLGHSW